MTEGKAIPHMTDLITILKDEDVLRSFLNWVAQKPRTKEEAANYLADQTKLLVSLETICRYVGSLATYHFVNLDKGKGLMTISRHSQEYLNNAMSYPDLTLNCLTSNIEWSYFLPDLFNIVVEAGSIKKTALTRALGHRDYDVTRRDSVERYLGEILPALRIAQVIDYNAGTATPGTRSKSEINEYASATQRELLNTLLMAERRQIKKARLRNIYITTVKSYLPLRKYRQGIAKLQEEIEEIRSMDLLKVEKDDQASFDSKWQLTGELWEWQKDYLAKWLQKRNGIAKVVTGAGKTRLALAAMQELKKNYPDLRVTIIVPTIVLLEQWFDTLVEELRISPKEINLRGGGYSQWDRNAPVRVIVINSAIRDEFLEKESERMCHHFLIVDECHRTGSAEFRKVYRTHRDWNLGLSATPERESDTAFDDILVKELGMIIGSYTYNDALRDNIIPPFDIYNYAVLLTNSEQAKYNAISKEIRKSLDSLKLRYPELNKPGVKLDIKLRVIQKRNPNDPDIIRYFQKTKERKNEIIYPAENRKRLVRQVLGCVLGGKDSSQTFNPGTPLSDVKNKDKVIIFHEKIDEINSLFMELDSKEVSIYHSGFPPALNRIGLNLYKGGQTKVLLSVKALIEGVNIPKTNLGIIMASSASQTQRIQSLGRVLRRAEGKENTRLLIIYVKDTTDERVYLKGINWSNIMGMGHVEFRLWSELGELIIQPPEARMEAVTKALVDESELMIGGEYYGDFSGRQLSFDSRGQLFNITRDGSRNYFSPQPTKLWEIFRRYKPTGGRLTINQTGHILIRDTSVGKLRVVYLGKETDYFDHDN